ncbi:hypothetical protein ASF34_20175 [Methylobacterium sp. Leaf106]|nr:hypothetical protein ASF34_20175 [Methylobacterium sp. Leaf106]
MKGTFASFANCETIRGIMGSTLEPCEPKITCFVKVFGFTELSGMLYLARAMPDAQSGLDRD